MMGDMLEREIKRALDTGSIVIDLTPTMTRRTWARARTLRA